MSASLDKFSRSLSPSKAQPTSSSHPDQTTAHQTPPTTSLRAESGLSPSPRRRTFRALIKPVGKRLARYFSTSSHTQASDPAHQPSAPKTDRHQHSHISPETSSATLRPRRSQPLVTPHAMPTGSATLTGVKRAQRPSSEFSPQAKRQAAPPKRAEYASPALAAIDDLVKQLAPLDHRLTRLNLEKASLSKEAFMLDLDDDDDHPILHALEQVNQNRQSLLATTKPLRQQIYQQLLQDLQPLQDMLKPHFTQSKNAQMQRSVIQANLKAIHHVHDHVGPSHRFTKTIERATLLRENGMLDGLDPSQKKQLLELTHHYHRLRDLEEIVAKTDAQLIELGGGSVYQNRQVDPATLKSLRDSEIQRHQEALDNGYNL